jgi:histidinol-phosphate aminotransferase
MMARPFIPPTRIPRLPYKRPTPRGTAATRLDGNEGRLPGTDAVTTLGDVSAQLLREYPSPAPLEALLAQRFGVAPESVIVTAGADDGLDRCCRAFLEPGREIVLPIPTFEMLYRFIAMAGGTPVTTEWRDRFPADQTIALIGPATSLVAIISPNNPTGTVATAEDVQRVAAAANGALVLLDHAYIEYAETDLTPLALQLPNVIVLRTFSKAWGLAGCRVGYLMAHPDVAAVLRSAGNPYPVSALSLHVVQGELSRGDAALAPHVARIRSNRSEVVDLLARAGIGVRPSQGNFVFADVPGRAEFVFEALRFTNVLVRYFPHREEIANGLRITVPERDDELEALRSAIALCTDPEAIVLDLDGVLANVEGSYRRCVIETAAEFGCTVTRADIQVLTHDGDANNDWVLTQRLLERRGVQADLDDIITRYQRHYEGTADRAGLRESEQLIAERETLTRLASRVPLAVVTGRPRGEAEWFLDRFGLTSLISETVCLGEAASKPDPAPVALALQKLNVTRAWMIGDTPDDIRAAAGAGVLPIGVVAPGDDPERTRRVLTNEGAVTVINTLNDLERLWP